MRNWGTTRQQTRKLWELTCHPGKLTKFDDLSKKYGISDSLNLQFAKQIQHIYRTNKKKPAADRIPREQIVERCLALEGKFGEHLFNPFLRLEGMSFYLVSLVMIQTDI